MGKLVGQVITQLLKAKKGALLNFDDRQYKKMECIIDKRESTTTRGIHPRRRINYDNIGWENSRILTRMENRDKVIVRKGYKHKNRQSKTLPTV